MGGPRGYVWVVTLVAALGLLAGCGPIEYVNQVTRKADSAIESAKSARADKYSPYYYTLAKEYLHKAREEAARADYQAANRFGRRAEEAAIKAREEAIARAGQPVEKFHPKVVPDEGDEGTGGDDEGGDEGGLAPLAEELE